MQLCMFANSEFWSVFLVTIYLKYVVTAGFSVGLFTRTNLDFFFPNMLAEIGWGQNILNCVYWSVHQQNGLGQVIKSRPLQSSVLES